MYVGETSFVVNVHNKEFGYVYIKHYIDERDSSTT